MTEEARVDGDGRVRLPPTVRETLEIESGDSVTFVATPDGGVRLETEGSPTHQPLQIDVDDLRRRVRRPLSRRP